MTPAEACTTGKVALGGGGTTEVSRVVNEPVITGSVATGWVVTANATNGRVTAGVICVTASAS
jgi:hypothetical protein